MVFTLARNPNGTGPLASHCLSARTAAFGSMDSPTRELGYGRAFGAKVFGLIS